VSAPAFELPHALEATAPPEARGVERDRVRLLVADGGTIFHARFDELPDLLTPGDLLVINVSATLPAAVAGTTAEGVPVRVHVATRAPDLGDRWRVVELRSPDGARPAPGAVGETIRLPGDHGAAGSLSLVARYAASTRLVLARFDGPGTVEDLLRDHGEPIRYGYVAQRWPLAAYQTVYATTPGSAEMPSAGRAFTPQLFTDLITRGVAVAPITLHTGVSSPEADEAPYPEPYRVPPSTAALVNHTHAQGHRVVAVGTTVVRALETVADETHTAHPGEGWTELVVTPQRGVRVVDGLLTGWHEPRASHLALVESVAGRKLLECSYQAAVQGRYRWHEFGDLHLVLP
jgi:S-adenosylmethionine:tRNA ribosyltransferase-isomerase